MKSKTSVARKTSPSTDNSAAFEQRVQKRLAELEIEQDLISLREEQGLTQAQLAEIAGVSQPFIAKLESGRAVNLELRTLVRIATALAANLEIRITQKTKTLRLVKEHKTQSLAASAGQR